jgi:predicted TIM-barrel fold metal-dependent hydrolase
MKIVLAHWGGGILFYELMREVSDLMSNVFYDTAATPLLYKNEIFNTSLNAVGARKILFGSDYPLIDQKNILKILNSQLLSPGDKSSISSENAKKVFKVKRLQQYCR